MQVKHTNAQRRSLLRAASVSAAGLSPAAARWPGAARQARVLPLRAIPGRAQTIVDRFRKPLAFRQQDFDITAFGAKPCKTRMVEGYVAHHEPGQVSTPVPDAPDCYGAIAAAIAACSQAGGGRVVIPAGNWLVKGPIVLKSHVNVHLARGAHVYFSTDPDDFARYGEYDCGANGKLTISRWQSNDCLNYSPLVYAYGQTNIALTGEDWTSILDGQGGVPQANGDCWWDWKGKRKPGPRQQEAQNVVNQRNPASVTAIAPGLTAAQIALMEGKDDKWRTDEAFLPTLSEAGVPVAKRVFGRGHYLRPCMVEFIGCTDVLLQGYQLNGSPFWQHHPVHCTRLAIRGVHMDSMGPNSDGFDPEACDTVLVEGCTFNSGDDCIAIKAGKNRDTQFGPTRNVVIQGCIMNSGHGGVTLGSEMSGGIEHVYAQDIEFRNAHWATDSLNTAIRMKTNMNRGGFLRHFYVRNVTMPNGVALKPQVYTPLPGSPIPNRSVGSSAGAVVTIDCDYAPTADNVRTRPPIVENVHISGVRVGNVKTKDGSFSCYQALLLLGPVAYDYNGPAGAEILPIRDVTITDCDFGNPVNVAQPWFVYNVRNVKLTNVTIGGKVVNTTLSA
ncbi:glycoside hydrolase family 28 protein [Massilia sp. Dwa41.01b]|uniref:glycoside hydrolase family 28 protein n=1 Tax=Massilia sp. Dwa41.01b TaxID=2709302 RepID=UPI0015FF53E6|nr:glycoside hydrolase family 28 protein [Massilia sp. Dwa41.01b]QNA89201.1 glycoside hydrolase family 28 protein [Massilia sp. Dwa41.01b]